MFNFLRFFKKENNVFPCKECLVRPSCRQACDKIEMDNDKLGDIAFKTGKCPDCGSKDFREGPSGGMSTNMMCASCNHWFNICEGIRLCDRIRISNGKFA